LLEIVAYLQYRVGTKEFILMGQWAGVSSYKNLSTKLSMAHSSGTTFSSRFD
jgi:hypothetical protein